jgi:hypothetical protein
VDESDEEGKKEGRRQENEINKKRKITKEEKEDGKLSCVWFENKNRKMYCDTVHTFLKPLLAILLTSLFLFLIY